MLPIQLATVLPGAAAFKEGNVNETFRGQVLLADGSVRQAILKDLDATQLSNEVLVSMLARAANLPTPEIYLGLVRATELPAWKGPALSGGGRIVFASADVKAPNVTFQVQHSTLAERNQLIRDIVEWSDLGRLYAFDSWIANIDRHPGNLLFGSKSELWLIDHGHCFSGPTWQPSDLRPDGDYANRLSEWVTGHLTEEEKRKRSTEAAGFAQAIARLDIRDAVARSRVASLLPSGYASAVETFLNARAKFVPVQANRALGMPTLL